MKLRFLDLYTSWILVVIFTPWPLYPPSPRERDPLLIGQDGGLVPEPV